MSENHRPEWASLGEQQAERTPWETGRVSFPADLLGSWLDVMTRPAEFFRMLDPGVSFSRPLSFYLLFIILGAGLSAASSLAVTPGEQTVAPYVWLFFFLSPFTGLLALLINSSLTQIGVRMFVKNAQPIHVTARVMCYAAATSVLSIIPWVGWLAAGIWSVVLMVVGIQGAHGTSAGRAAAAVFVPIILITVALALLFIVLAMVMALAIGAGA